MEQYDVLFFSAHPDDVEFAMGGTHIKLAKKYRTAHVILTRGESGTYGTPKDREEEARCAAKLTGSTLEFLSFKDNHVEDTVENAKALAEVIRKYRPRVVFTPYHTNHSTHKDYLSHPDHTALGAIVLKACRFARFKNAPIKGEKHSVERIIYYMVPLYMRPTFIVDVTDVMEESRHLWNCFPSQLQIAGGKVLDYLTTDRKYTGMINGIGYAEGFLIEESITTDDPLRL